MDRGIIFKYPINLSGTTTVKVPVHSKLLSIKAQGDNVVVYFLENVEQSSSDGVTEYEFYSVGTGHAFEMVKATEYLNTVMLYEGRFVLHVFRV